MGLHLFQNTCFELFKKYHWYFLFLTHQNLLNSIITLCSSALKINSYISNLIAIIYCIIKNLIVSPISAFLSSLNLLIWIRNSYVLFSDVPQDYFNGDFVQVYCTTVLILSLNLFKDPFSFGLLHRVDTNI